MPIRMVQDDNNESNNNNPGNNNQPRRTGGGGLGSLLPLLLGLLFKKPKLAIVLLIIAAIGYYLMNNMIALAPEENSNALSTGCDMKEEIFDQAEVFAALANGSNVLPEAVSLLQFCPTRGNQGSQGSCVAWSSAYAARTILQARATGYNPDDVVFSPSYLYNQIALGGCQGSYIKWAMENMSEKGSVPFNRFAYDEDDCSRKPGSNLLSEASGYKIKGYNRLTMDDDDYKVDVMAMKQNLSQGAPVVIGMMVGQSFMQNMIGRKVWIPTQQDYYMRGMGGHAMCVIGYDDNLQGGAFQIMNSWGMDWGQNGIGWVRYKDFEHFAREAYGLYPMGSAQKPISSNSFDVTFGLIRNDNQQIIALEQSNDVLFKTKNPIKKGDKFKIEVTNSEECYTYVFGQETDGSSYVLFPYTKKHSPYCGIVGTRLFPRDYSLQADDKGNSDFMAIVVTKKPLDFERVNQQINAVISSNYLTKFKQVFNTVNIENIDFNAENGKFGFKNSTKDKDIVLMILQIDKN